MGVQRGMTAGGDQWYDDLQTVLAHAKPRSREGKPQRALIRGRFSSTSTSTVSLSTSTRGVFWGVLSFAVFVLVLDFNLNSRQSAGVSPCRVGRCGCFADASSVFPPASGMLTAQPREKPGGGLPAGSVWPPSVARAFQPEICPQATPFSHGCPCWLSSPSSDLYRPQATPSLLRWQRNNRKTVPAATPLRQLPTCPSVVSPNSIQTASCRLEFSITLRPCSHRSPPQFCRIPQRSQQPRSLRFLNHKSSK